MYARVVRRHPARGQRSRLARRGRTRACPIPGSRSSCSTGSTRSSTTGARRRAASRCPAGAGCTLPGIHQYHEGDWEAVTVGLSADRPLFVDWSAHCAGEWRPFAGATLVADAGGERTHPVSWIALGSHANLPAAVTARPRWWRCDPRVATFVHQRVEAHDRIRRDASPSATASTTRSGSSTAPGSGAPQAFPLALVNRLTWPMTFPGIWGGRERIEVGPAGARARLVAADADAAEALARPARDDLRRRRPAAAAAEAHWPDVPARGLQRYGDVDSPHSRPLAHSRCNRAARALSKLIHYTDAACPWAYNFEPALRALEARYGDQLSVRTVMIGLSESHEEYEARGYTAEGTSLSRRRFRWRGMPMATGPRPAPVRHGPRLPPRQGRRAPGRAAGRGRAARRCASRGSRPTS